MKEFNKQKNFKSNIIYEYISAGKEMQFVKDI